MLNLVFCPRDVRCCAIMSTFGLMYFLYFLYFRNLFRLSIQTSMQNLESVAQKLIELC